MFRSDCKEATVLRIGEDPDVTTSSRGRGKGRGKGKGATELRADGMSDGWDGSGTDAELLEEVLLEADFLRVLADIVKKNLARVRLVHSQDKIS